MSAIEMSIFANRKLTNGNIVFDTPVLVEDKRAPCPDETFAC